MKSISLFVVASFCMILSVTAGGQRQGIGLPTSAGSTTTSLANGRSPLGEPVFLIPSSNSSRGRFLVSEKHMLERPTLIGGTDHSTHIIFTPPPTIVGVPASATATGNIAGANLAERPFGPSVFNLRLGERDLQQVQPPWIRITPLQYK